MSGTSMFFSIVVPAHNEERYIGKTLQALTALSYPKDRYEVLVIENGSTDNTLAQARAYEDEHIAVYSFTERGVSFARNRGVERSRPDSDWIVFVDADTTVLPAFLGELSKALEQGRRPACGTTQVRPLSDRVTAQVWFCIYDVVHELFHNSWALFFVDASIARTLTFNEQAVLMEDQQYLRAAAAFGAFKFVHTNTVSTSIRRFEQDGWLRPILLYTYVGLLPASLQELYGYNAVR